MVMFSLLFLFLFLFFGYQKKFAELHLFSWPPGYPESTLTEADGKMSRTGS